jgi:hypothetical protein
MPVKFATDENFNNNILRGLQRRQPMLDILRIQDVDLSGVDDPVILEWAAQQQRVLLTHDARTMPKFAYERLDRALAVSGVVVIKSEAPIRQVIEDILILAEFEAECRGQIRYVPF